MSKHFELDQTSIPSQYGVSIDQIHNYNWISDMTPDLYRVIFYTMAERVSALRDQTPKAKKVGFSYKTTAGDIVCGAILSFHDSETDENEGNWYLEFTFDAEDMNSGDFDAIADNHDSIFFTIFCSVSKQIMNSGYRDNMICYNVIMNAFNVLKNFLDVNASELEDVTVELPGVFAATVEIENGEKIFSIVPGETTKQIVKSDANLKQKAA